MHESEKWKWSHSVVSDSQRPHGLQPSRLLCPWDSPDKSTGVGCDCLLLEHYKNIIVFYVCCDLKEIQKHGRLLSSLQVNIFRLNLLALLKVIVYSNNALALFNLFPCLLSFLYIIPFPSLNPLLILLEFIFIIFFPKQSTELVYILGPFYQRASLFDLAHKRYLELVFNSLVPICFP